MKMKLEYFIIFACLKNVEIEGKAGRFQNLAMFQKTWKTMAKQQDFRYYGCSENVEKIKEVDFDQFFILSRVYQI